MLAGVVGVGVPFRVIPNVLGKSLYATAKSVLRKLQLSKKKLIGVVFLLAMVSLTSVAILHTNAQASAASPPGFYGLMPGTHYYPVKFACGTFTASNIWGLAPGTYSTTINVHNPSYSTYSQTVVKKFVLATPEVKNNQVIPPGITTTLRNVRNATIEPDGVMAITCTDIERTLGVAPAEGMVMIYTTAIPTKLGTTIDNSTLDVWAFYSTQYSLKCSTTTPCSPPSVETVQVLPSQWMA